jgi:hypothetical protein
MFFSAALVGAVDYVDKPVSSHERRTSVRESLVFFVGAGSSMTMQFLPVVIASRLSATAIAALLFGALQATTPLLLLSRIYSTIMMPAFAGAGSMEEASRHVNFVRPFFFPSLAIALGMAPWIPLTLGLPDEPAAISISAMVALITLLQVWATPAVTVLSARRQEFVPAAASVGGLAVAAVVWWVAVKWHQPLLLATGLALGAVVRSLVPMWVLSGKRRGALDSETVRFLGVMCASAVALVFLARAGRALGLAGATVLLLVGIRMSYRLVHQGRAA